MIVLRTKIILIVFVFLSQRKVRSHLIRKPTVGWSDSSQAYKIGKMVVSETLKVPRLVRSVKNSFAPVNRIPPDILSLIPDHCGYVEDDADRIALIHACRCFGDVFVSRSSLWTKLDFMNAKKANTYIQRSKSSPSDIYLKDSHITYLGLVIPHVQRIESLTIYATAPPDSIKYFNYPISLPEELDIQLNYPPVPGLNRPLHSHELLCCIKVEVDCSDPREVSKVGVGFREMQRPRPISNCAKTRGLRWEGAKWGTLRLFTVWVRPPTPTL